MSLRYKNTSDVLQRTPVSADCLFLGEHLQSAAQPLEDCELCGFNPELLSHKSQLKISDHVRQPIEYQRRFGHIVVKTDE